MQQILKSHFDPSTKQSLAELYSRIVERTLATPHRAPRDIIEAAIANALIDLASAGQRNPEQLTRYAEYRASVV
ncbi:MAG: hypothetical protein Q7T86_04355 [Hyphomicrobiaceae bacterium]|jgi:hypothetical protein|nr:hypothetical protein [Hyphomicrobiaceae bacterium]